MSNMSVAKTILEQLGGNKFRMMTGAKHFMGFAEGLVMKIGRNSSNSNYLKHLLLTLECIRVYFNMVLNIFNLRVIILLIIAYSYISFFEKWNWYIMYVLQTGKLFTL